MAKTHAKRLSDIVALLALCAACWLALSATTVHADTNAKQRVTEVAKKPEVKKQEARKPEPKAAATPAREAADKKASPRKTARKGKPVKHAAKAERGKKQATD